MPTVETILHAGDDYSASGQGAIPFTITDAPNLTGATSITLEITRGGVAKVTAAGTLVAATYPAPQVVAVPLTALQTAGLSLRSYGYVLRATLSNGNVVTLGHGETGSVMVTRSA